MNIFNIDQKQQDDNVLTGIILSKKITKTIIRHFATWKKRLISINNETNIFSIKATSGEINNISLRNAKLICHHYSINNAYCLSIQFCDDKYASDIEVSLQFLNENEMILYRNFISNTIKKYEIISEQSNKQVLNILNTFLNEKLLTNDDVIIKNNNTTSNIDDIILSGKKIIKFDKNSEMEWGVWKDVAYEQIWLDSVVNIELNNNILNEDDEEIIRNIDNTRNLNHINDIINKPNNNIKSQTYNRKFQRKVLYNTHSNVMMHAGDKCDFWQIPVPKLRILLMVVGTRGDVQPFIKLGQKLQKDGHRVRLATHTTFRGYVLTSGLEFYPLAGDPYKLSEFMVKTSGFILPTSTELMKEFPLNLSMVLEITHSCWGACVSPDPEDINSQAFVADAIISNPVTYGHVHVAEALGVPLHMMFPQPWIATKAFPHPLSCLSYERGWSSENFTSYQIIDQMVWMSMESEINNFRKNTLELEPIRMGDGGWNLMNQRKIPFAKMWSPALVPKPKDWGEHVDIVGTFFENSPLPVKELETNIIPPIPVYQPSPELESFLSSSNKPLFIGFGSMIIEDIEGLVTMIIEGAALAGVRVILQAGWSEMPSDKFLEISLKAQEKSNKVYEAENIMMKSVIFSNNDNNNNNNNNKEEKNKFDLNCSQKAVLYKDSPCSSNNSIDDEQFDDDFDDFDDDDCIDKNMKWDAKKDAILIGPCPHSWLFNHVSCVVHHGGAGTTAAGLLAGLPTWICPFFGDQFFWGEIIRKKNLGPRPCPVNKLTLQTVVDSFTLLQSIEFKENASAISEILSKEDGVKGASDAFYHYLPIENMICDVSIFMGKSQLAQVYCSDCGLKMCRDISQRIHRSGVMASHHISPCSYINYSTKEPTNATEGIVKGVVGLVSEIAGGFTEAIIQPARGAYNDGFNGGATGALLGLKSLIKGPVAGGAVLLDKMKTGIRGSITTATTTVGMKEISNSKTFDYSNPNVNFNGDVRSYGMMKYRSESISEYSEYYDNKSTNNNNIIANSSSSSTSKSISKEVYLNNNSIKNISCNDDNKSKEITTTVSEDWMGDNEDILDDIQFEEPPWKNQFDSDSEKSIDDYNNNGNNNGVGQSIFEGEDDIPFLISNQSPTKLDNVSHSIEKLINNEDKKDSLIITNELLTSSLQSISISTSSINSNENNNSNIDLTNSQINNYWNEDEKIINSAYIKAIEVQSILHNLIGSKSRIISFDHFSKILGNALNLSKDSCVDNDISNDEIQLQSLTIDLVELIARKKKYLDYIDFSLLYLHLEKERNLLNNSNNKEIITTSIWNNIPDRKVGIKNN